MRERVAGTSGHLWKYEELPPVAIGQQPNVLLVGNGINRVFAGKAWEDLICDAIANNGCPYGYSDIKDMPANMQIVVASAKGSGAGQTNEGGLRNEIKNVARSILVRELSKDNAKILEKILNLPADAILTTNYSNEFEVLATGKPSMRQFCSSQRRTKDVRGVTEQFRLFQYSSMGAQYPKKTVWHIHGDVSKPSSMVIGHYYYGKLLMQIQEQVRSCVREYKIAERKGIPYVPQSWVDYFLIGNVHMLAFGMDMAEQDLWWLLACKKKEFPNTKTFFYQAEKNLNKHTKKLLLAYGVELVTNIPLSKESYLNFYNEALERIRRTMLGGGADHV